VTIWDVATGQVAGTLRGHTDKVRPAVFSPDGARLATASRDGTARVWDARTGAPLKRLEHPNWVNGVAFSPDGARLASTGQDGAGGGRGGGAGRGGPCPPGPGDRAHSVPRTA